MGSVDPQLERQVETIRNLVDSYIKIINKTTRDIVPKIVMHLIINNVREFVKHEIIAYIYSAGDQNTLMEESADEAIRREETLRIYHATKEALRIIGDVARDTIAEPIPPPIRYDTSMHQSSLSAPMNSSYDRPSSPKPGARQAPPAPGGRGPAPPPSGSRPAPPAPAAMQQQQQQTPISTATSMATSLGNLNKSSQPPPGRPAQQLPTPLIPQANAVNPSSPSRVLQPPTIPKRPNAP